MLESDVLSYKISKNMPYNKNLKIFIAFVGLKYNMVSEYIVSGEKSKMVKMKATKKLICKKCFEYFNITITLKQINYLLKPQKGMFPYTATIIIETIYNLLKDEEYRYNPYWKNQCFDYLDKYIYNDLKYEEFMIGKIPEYISSKTSEFSETNKWEIYKCFIDSREIFQETFGETTIRDCMERFPINQLTNHQVPRTMRSYQEEKIYIKNWKGGK